MTKLIVFDLDGVLLDFCEVHYETLNQAICEVAGLQYCISRDEHETIYNGRSTRAKLAMLGERKGLAPLLFEGIFARKQELTASAVSRVSKSDVLFSLFTRLRKEGYQTACATNCIRATLDSALDALGIRDLFTFTISNEDVHSPKPDPEIYKLCHQKAGVTPIDTLIFEDSPIGLASARASGSKVVCVPTPSSLTEEFVMTTLSPITIVIPMAGNGSRFTKAGYADPKPLIPVRGKPMISWVVNNLAVPRARFVFVIRADYPESCKEYLRSIAPGCFIIVVDKVTEGAACTVLLAKDLINNDTPLLIANSDQFIEFDVGQFVHSFLNSGADGKISTFNGDRNPKWSYAAVKDGYVTEVREKDPFSDHATTGVYMWRRGSDFVRFAEQMISKNIRVNNEFYTVPVYNEAIADGLKITIDTCKQMWGLGVPEDLEYFLSNYKCFMSKTYFYGDSHVESSFKGFNMPYECRVEKSCTMHRVGRDKAIPNWKACSQRDTAVFSFGEVDCRAHIGKQIELGRTEDEVIDTLTKDYIDTIRANTHCRVIIVAVIPPTARKDYEASVPNGGFPFVSSDEDRVRYTKSVNNHLYELCRENNFVFFDPYEPYTRDDGCLRRELSDGNVHVGDTRYVLSSFNIVV